MRVVEKIIVKAENRAISKHLALRITKREDVEPLLGMDWLREIILMIKNFESMTKTTNH